MGIRNGLVNPGNGWKRRLAFVAGIGLIIVWATRASVAPDTNALKVQGPDTLGNPLFTAQAPPSFALALNQATAASSANAAATNNVTLAGAAGLTTYCTGFEVTGAGATAASVITITLTGGVATPLNYQLAIPAGATVGVTPLIVEFNPPIPANSLNQAIVLAVPSFGAGNTNAAAVIHGFRQ